MEDNFHTREIQMQDNRKIANFMELPLYGEKEFLHNGSICDYSNMKYRTSWDWLMPVVEKIFTLKYDEINGLREYANSHSNIFDPIHCGLHSTIDHIYIKVVQFIEWYNKTKNQ